MGRKILTALEVRLVERARFVVPVGSAFKGVVPATDEAGPWLVFERTEWGDFERLMDEVNVRVVRDGVSVYPGATHLGSFAIPSGVYHVFRVWGDENDSGPVQR